MRLQKKSSVLINVDVDCVVITRKYYIYGFLAPSTFIRPRRTYFMVGQRENLGKENKKYLFFDRCNLEIYRTTSTLTLTIRDVG